jgi:hypothetical protein
MKLASEGFPDASPSSIPTVEASATQTSLLSPDNGKKSRRSTLSVMVESIVRSIKVRSGRSSTRDLDTPSHEKESSREPSGRQSRSMLPTSTSGREAVLGEKVSRAPDTIGHGMPASSSKARKVMQWFRSWSKGRVCSPIHRCACSGMHAFTRALAPTTTLVSILHPRVCCAPVPRNQAPYSKRASGHRSRR